MRERTHSLFFTVIILLIVGCCTVAKLEAEEVVERSQEELQVEGSEMLAGEMTASELLVSARSSFARGEYPKAIELFEAFYAGYAEDPQVLEAVKSNRPFLALSYIHIQQYDTASPLLTQALEEAEHDELLVDEMLFWKAICQYLGGDYEKARESLGSYYQRPQALALRRREAIILYGKSLLAEEKYPQAADFFGKQVGKLLEQNQEAGQRALLLQFYSLVEAEMDKEAADLLIHLPLPMEKISQVVSFQVLALRLGSRLLEQESFLPAVAVLQRIWRSERLLSHQAEELAEVGARIKQGQSVKAGTAAPLLFQLRGVESRIKQEVEKFSKLENFDSALRLRLASAFQGLERYRESAIILEEMLLSRPPDKIVQQGSVSLVQSWMEVGRWDKAVQAADLYAEKFSNLESDDFLPSVLFMRAQALQEDRLFAEAEEGFARIPKLFPEHQLAAKASFMKSIARLRADKNREAVAGFLQFRVDYPDDPLLEDSRYWEAMAYSFLGKHQKAQSLMEQYIDDYHAPKYRIDALFRIAFSQHALSMHEQAAQSLALFVEQFPSSEYAEEAKLLLGDSLFAFGEIDSGVEAYASINPEAQRFWEDGYFKTAKAYRLQEDYAAMEKHFSDFIKEYPDSPRLAEAVYWLGWIQSEKGEVEAARSIYWNCFRELGDDAARFSVEDLLGALPKLYQGDQGREQLLLLLDQFASDADARGEKTAAMRALWARGQVYGAENDALRAASLIEASLHLDPQIHNPQITADCADVLRETGRGQRAAELYQTMRRWHPRALQKDRAYLGLGMITAEAGEAEQAIEYFERFERESFHSAYLGQVYLQKAKLWQGLGEYSRAQESLDALLAEESLAGRAKAQALYQYGELASLKKDPQKAAACYERIYLLYGKYHDLVAEAYWQRGLALEQLDMKERSLEVYRELLARSELEQYSVYAQASEKVAVLEQQFPGKQAKEAEEGKEEL